MLQQTALLVLAKDETEMIGEHQSYHERITGEEAERRLKLFDRHCYLTRFSKNSDCYVLSVYQRQRPDDIAIHFEIVINQNGKLNIKGKTREFDDIRQLLRHYEQHRIDPALKNIGRICTQQEYELAEERHQQEVRRRQEEERQQAEQDRQRLEERRQEEARRQEEERRLQEAAQRRRSVCRIL